MKRFSKVCLIICLMLFCLGIVCICAGAAMGSSMKEAKRLMNEGNLNLWGFDIGEGLFYWDDDEELKDTEVIKGVVEKSFLAEDIEELDIDLDYGYIVVEDGDSENITISIDAPKRRSYACKAEGKVLELEETTRHPGVNHNSLKANITIRIPRGKEFKEVDFSTSAGKVEISHNLSAGEMSLDVDAGELKADSVTAKTELELETGAGEITLENFSADTVYMDCGVGNMNVSGKVERDLDAVCGVGNITLNLEGKTEDYNYDISCGVGSIRINDETYSALGSDKEIDNNAPGEISLECGVGSIEVKIKE